MSNYKFSQLRLQLVALADSAPSLTDKGLRVLLRLLIQHLNWKDGTWNTTDAELATDFGCSTDTISRAIASIERAGLLEVTRGRWGRASQYKVSERAWKQASEMRQELRISADQANSQTLQRSGMKSASLRCNSPQDCRPSCIKELNNCAEGPCDPSASWPDLPYQGHPAKPVNTQSLVFVPSGICFVRDWDDRLEKLNMPKLERSLPQSSQGGQRGFWLPARIPAQLGSAEWQQQLLILRTIISAHIEQQCVATKAEELSKVTHVATPPTPCEGMGEPFPLDPKPGAWLSGSREP